MTQPGSTKPCPLSSWQSSRPLGLLAKYVCHGYGSSYGPTRATAAKPSSNAGHEPKRERPCQPTQCSWSMPGSVWRLS